MNISSSTSQFDVAKMATAAHVLHKLWVGRCCATYDNKPMRARQICIRVIHKVKLIMLLHTPKRPSTKFQHLRLELLGLTRKHVKVKVGAWYRWEAPAPGTYKLNIDGSACDNKITGGGVVRDCEGHFIAGFSNM